MLRDEQRPIFPNVAKRLQSGAIGFAADQQQSRFGRTLKNPVANFQPARERPVFLFAAAAGMHGDERRIFSRQKFHGHLAVRVARMKRRRGILEIKRELLERARELLRGVRGIIEARRDVEKMFDAAPAQIVFENLIRIVKIADDLLETREIFDEFRREFRVRNENLASAEYSIERVASA